MIVSAVFFGFWSLNNLGRFSISSFDVVKKFFSMKFRAMSII